MVNREDVFIHETADVSDEAVIGKGTRIWHHAQVMAGAVIGGNCNLGKGVFVAGSVKVGNNVKIQNYISLYNGITVEDDVILGPNMTFTNDLYPRAFVDDFVVYETLVRKGSAIGANATIVCGVTLNEYSMVAAGAVVMNDVPSYALVMGNPGRISGYVCKCGKRLTVEKKPVNDDSGNVVKCDKCGMSFEVQPGLLPIL